MPNNNKTYLAQEVVKNLKIYSIWLEENRLDNDCNSIAVQNLMDFVTDQIDPEDYKRLEEFTKEMD